MHLKEYMLRRGMRNYTLAKELDCSIPQIVLARKGKVSAKFARQLAKYTGGVVTVSEILSPTPWPPALEDEGDKAA